MEEYKKWMKIAIIEATKGEAQGEVPVGAVLVQNGKLISKAHNQPITLHDATAHAEIQLIRDSGLKQKNYRLPDTTMFITLEPCMMCLGAIYHARISQVVFGAYDLKTGFISSKNNIQEIMIKKNINIIGGILEDECKNLIQSFFKRKRKLK